MSSDMDDQQSEDRKKLIGKAIAEKLAAAPREQRVSLRQIVYDNKELLRRHRDEGVSWNEIGKIIEAILRDAEIIGITIDSKTVQVYLARAYPAKKARALKHAEQQFKNRGSEEKPSSPRGANVQDPRKDQDGSGYVPNRSANLPVPIRPDPPPGSGVNPFISKRPTPKNDGAP